MGTSSIVKCLMVKFLALILFIVSTQAALANDFLRSDKQVLLCTPAESHLRINWEDFESDKRHLSIRTKGVHLIFSPSVDRDSAEANYFISYRYEIFENGKVEKSKEAKLKISENLKEAGDGAPAYLKIRFIDKSASEPDVSKICGVAEKS